MDDQFLREFLVEAEDLIESLAVDLEALRARRTMGRARRELLGRIFRHAHTLKGSAASVELEATGRIADEFETLLAGVRAGRVPLDEPVLNAFEDAAAALSKSLNAAARGESQTPSPALLKRLHQLAFETYEKPEPDYPQVLAALPEEVSRTLNLSQHEAHLMAETAQEGAHLFILSARFDFFAFDEPFRDLSEALNAQGEIVSTQPGTEAATPDRINFRIIYATEANREELARLLSPFGASIVIELNTDRLAQQTASTGEPHQVPLEEDAQTDGIGPLTAHVRVDLQELDEVIYTAHEIFRETTDALKRAASVVANVSGNELSESEAARLSNRFVEFEEKLIRLRMVPLARTLKRAMRAGMIAARLTGKDVAFEIAGGEMLLDKSLVDVISDPLLHIIRNAVDHGIETPEERLAKGKNRRGSVRLEAMAEGSRVHLRVSDDGRGIDPERVAQAAREQAIINAGATVNMQQALRLIFRPGFSTAGAVSSVSGRGVGLDVVEHTLEQVGGEIRVWSETGTGTKFNLLLPTTLALVPSLLVQSAGYRYCIDASHILETGLVSAVEIERVDDAEIIRWRGAALPLVRLSTLLHRAQTQALNEDHLHLIITQAAGPTVAEAHERKSKRTVAVAVDGWDGQEKMLVRALGRHAVRWQAVGGATELSDGTVALLLDLPRLLEYSSR